MPDITLFIPGLLTPARDFSQQDIPSIPSVQKILSCGQRKKNHANNISQIIFDLFNIKNLDNEQLPVAPLTHAIDEDQHYEGIWMRADPVHLSADINKMILMDESVFNLDQHDALILAADIRYLFTENGMQLYAPTTNRWYVKLDKLPEITTVPVYDVVGKDIRPSLPAGNDRVFWNRLLNEIQMCLHGSPINENRIARGELPINSLWFWGCGTLPQKPEVSWNKVYSDDVMTKGLSRLSGSVFKDLPDNISAILGELSDQDSVLIVILFGYYHTQYKNYNGWLDFISYLEEFWFGGLIDALKQNKITSLCVMDEINRVSMTKRSLFKFWKGNISVEKFLS